MEELWADHDKLLDMTTPRSLWDKFLVVNEVEGLGENLRRTILDLLQAMWLVELH